MGKLYLTCGDFILNTNNMDAIVNAQNKYMQYGSGICGAIYRASGNELIEYCKNNGMDLTLHGLILKVEALNLERQESVHILW